MLSSLEKQKWGTKVHLYDFDIIYKKGGEASALSQKYEEKWYLLALSFSVPDCLGKGCPLYLDIDRRFNSSKML